MSYFRYTENGSYTILITNALKDAFIAEESRAEVIADAIVCQGFDTWESFDGLNKEHIVEMLKDLTPPLSLEEASKILQCRNKYNTSGNII